MWCILRTDTVPEQISRGAGGQGVACLGKTAAGCLFSPLGNSVKASTADSVSDTE